jgi:hypothetical protein
MQLPLRHWWLVAHIAPVASCGWHTGGLLEPSHQKPGPTQSVSTAQEVLQAVGVAQPRLPVQGRLLIVQEPEVQVDEVSLPPVLHASGAQGVPSLAWQLPLPLQLSLTQPPRLAVHSFFGSLPTVAATHAVPALVTTLQTGHDATELQRMSLCAWTHIAVWHWLLAVHTVPVASFGAHAPAVQ